MLLGCKSFKRQANPSKTRFKGKAEVTTWDSPLANVSHSVVQALFHTSRKNQKRCLRQLTVAYKRLDQAKYILVGRGVRRPQAIVCLLKEAARHAYSLQPRATLVELASENERFSNKLLSRRMKVKEWGAIFGSVMLRRL